jgi:hypothetical protein
MLKQCQLYGSLQSWVKVTTFKNSRNRHECEAIAQAVDALLSEGVPSSSLGIEVLLRRLSGVHLADQVGEWRVCESVEWNAHGNSLLPPSVVAQALKDAERMKKLYAAVSNSNAAAARRSSFAATNNGGNTNASAKP